MYIVQITLENPFNAPIKYTTLGNIDTFFLVF